MKFPVLIIFVMVLIPAFAFLMLIRVAQSELEIFLHREHDETSGHQPE